MGSTRLTEILNKNVGNKSDLDVLTSPWSTEKALEIPYEAWTEKVTRHFWKKDCSSKEAGSLLVLIPVIKIARIFGVMPLSIHVNSISFQWFSFLSFYAIVIIGVQLLNFLLRITALVRFQDILRSKDESKVKENWIEVVQTTTFYALGLSGSIALLRTAMYFPSMIDKFSDIEYRLGTVEFGKLRSKILLLTWVVLISAAGETIASMFYKLQLEDVTDIWELYIRRGNLPVIHLLDYSRPLGVLLLLNNKFATFVWNYLDLIISAAAMVLTAIVTRYNFIIEKATKSSVSMKWSTLREIHLEIYQLGCSVNEIFGPLILQSYITNLSFILLQVYNGLKNLFNLENENSMVDSLYLTWSFLHLLGRLFLVSTYCAKLHEKSLQVLPILLAVPENRYVSEIRRLGDQAQQLTIGLTGLDFFLVNKNFILAITGALFTYEVILLQFNPKN